MDPQYLNNATQLSFGFNISFQRHLPQYVHIPYSCVTYETTPRALNPNYTPESFTGLLGKHRCLGLFSPSLS